MAESEVKSQTEMVQDNDKKLEYLDFVQVAAINVIVCFSTIYDYAKQNSGPLKPGLQAIEDTVKTVIGPVYEKFLDVPFELLKFVDRKVDDYLSELEKHVPSLVKQESSQARAMACEVQRAGTVDAAKSIVKTMFTKTERHIINFDIDNVVISLIFIPQRKIDSRYIHTTLSNEGFPQDL
ncbi:hypothetical protein GH714_037456 [Hevea brasiliensis]|uniref:Uncharacterized protein n=1 Tax=Hevea brasiliensis TaxID=3981 RepID=A0A6A6MPQ3_HEVBR|nr:hypothetical protein GH714_037456 [Hevea brasiliensis]